MRIVPQIRRQLPEAWRWTMPLPLASGALRDPARARIHDLRAQLRSLGAGGDQRRPRRPRRGRRDRRRVRDRPGDPGRGGRAGRGQRARDQVHRADGRAAGALPDLPARRRAHPRPRRRRAGHDGTATAARTEVPHGADPSATGKALAFQRPGRAGVLRFRGHTYQPARARPGRRRTVRGRDLRRRPDQDPEPLHREPIGSVSAPDAQALAISPRWLAYLAVDGDRYCAARAAAQHPADPGRGEGRRLRVASPVQLGHPSLDGGRSSTRSRSVGRNSIKRRNLNSGKGGTVLRSRTRRAAESLRATASTCSTFASSRRAEPPLATPSQRLRQTLMIKRLGGHGPGHRIYSHGPDRTLWTTALAGQARPSSPCSATVARRSSRPTASTNRIGEIVALCATFSPVSAGLRVCARYGGARTCGGMFPTPIAR